MAKKRKTVEEAVEMVGQIAEMPDEGQSELMDLDPASSSTKLIPVLFDFLVDKFSTEGVLKLESIKDDQAAFFNTIYNSVLHFAIFVCAHKMQVPMDKLLSDLTALGGEYMKSPPADPAEEEILPIGPSDASDTGENNV